MTGKSYASSELKVTFTSKVVPFVLIALLITIGTFPNTDWQYSPGIDSSLCWLFNNLFKHHISLGKSIIFPHGPLAFFTYPLPENIIVGLIVQSFLKFLLIVNLYFLWVDRIKSKKWFVIGLVAYLYCIIANFNMLILINILLLYCNFFNLKKIYFKYIAFVLTGFALFLKANIAIMSGLLFITFVIYWYYKTKSIKQLLIDCICLLAIMQIIWVLIYKSFAGFASYIIGIFYLVQDNSSAVSSYPYNNWWILFLFFLFLVTLFIVNRSKKSVFYFWLISLCFFAAWKHGMSREDIPHTQVFFSFIICFLLVFILFQREKINVNLTLSIGVLVLFFVNRKFADTYLPNEYRLFNGKEFLGFLTSFSKMKNDLENISQKNIIINKLPVPVRKAIANSTVDIYPWDYTIISANGLNLRPRIVIQSYASYTSWLDNQNATHFNSNKAPDFLIWQLQKVTSDVNGGLMNSIDDRYLLNDEPQTMLQILTHYEYFYSDDKFKIYKKRTTSIKTISKRIGHFTLNWNQWIDVPNVKNNLLRAKLSFEKKFLQRIKSFLYKDEQFWIYLGLKNGEIHKYRIVPKNAEDGLWIMPYIYNSTSAYSVEKIMFKCSQEEIVTNKIEIDWEEVKFGDSPKYLIDFFHVKELTTDSVITAATINFDKKLESTIETQLSDISFTGKKSYLLKPKSVSSIFSIQLDSLAFSNFKIITDFWLKAPYYIFRYKVALTLSIEDKNGIIIKKKLPVDRQIIDDKNWNNIYSTLDYQHDNPHCLLNIYINNNSNENIFIDDFRVMITKKK